MLGVLDAHLKGVGRSVWLAISGEPFPYFLEDWRLIRYCSTVADISFATWDRMILWIFGDEAGSLQIEKDYPIYHVWHELTQRPSMQKVVQDRQKTMSGR